MFIAYVIVTLLAIAANAFSGVAWLCFEDESGQGLRPPVGRTWGRRGQTPVVRVTGGSNKRVSLAALIAVRPGCRPRLIYRVHHGRRSRDDRRRGSPRPVTPGCSMMRTSSSAGRSWWCETA
jgi:hypothetical protein